MCESRKGSYQCTCTCSGCRSDGSALVLHRESCDVYVSYTVCLSSEVKILHNKLFWSQCYITVCLLSNSDIKENIRAAGTEGRPQFTPCRDISLLVNFFSICVRSGCQGHYRDVDWTSSVETFPSRLPLSRRTN